MNSVTQDRAERQARRLARRHYENFPVASLLLPRAYRAPVALIYAFARRADDIADEGDMSSAQRLQALEEMRNQLDLARAGGATRDSNIAALAHAMGEFGLPWECLYDLLAAFAQDVTVSRYRDFESLRAYCTLSANPVGRLLLHLYDAATAHNVACSDSICTSLQLINFLQDVDDDYRLRGRIYVPEDDMTRFGVDESDFRQRRNDRRVHELFHFQLQRAAELLHIGSPLARALPGRYGRELRAVIAGGRRMLKKLQRRSDPFQRPRMHAGDWIAVAWSAVRP